MNNKFHRKKDFLRNLQFMITKLKFEGNTLKKILFKLRYYFFLRFLYRIFYSIFLNFLSCKYFKLYFIKNLKNVDF